MSSERHFSMMTHTFTHTDLKVKTSPTFMYFSFNTMAQKWNESVILTYQTFPGRVGLSHLYGKSIGTVHNWVQDLCLTCSYFDKFLYFNVKTSLFPLLQWFIGTVSEHLQCKLCFTAVTLHACNYFFFQWTIIQKCGWVCITVWVQTVMHTSSLLWEYQFILIPAVTTFLPNL